MARDTMFQDVVEASVRIGRKRRSTLSFSILVHVAVIATAVTIPMMAPGVLPDPPAVLSFVQTAAPPPGPPPVRQSPQANTARNSNAAPLESPSEIGPEKNVQATAVSPIPCVENPVAGPGCIPNGQGPAMASLAVGATVPGPPAIDVTPPPTKIPVGGNVRAPAKIKDARPVYPSIAQSARVEGVVIIEATIGPTGKVEDARVLRSIPLLDAAALDAVRKWEFTPTLLNGAPVSVIMTVTVDFKLR